MRIATTFALAIAAIFGPTAVQAATINYGDFLGLNVGDADFLDVTEDSATDMTPLFESPFFAPNTLDFIPIAMKSVKQTWNINTFIPSPGIRKMRMLSNF